MGAGLGRQRHGPGARRAGAGPRLGRARPGCFVSTASAAGLLTQLGSPTYSATKHAAVGFAEWLAATYGDRGVQVCCLCPMGVRTDMLARGRDQRRRIGRLAMKSVVSAGATLTPLEVADVLLEAIEAGTFFALPHPEVGTMYARKAADTDHWITGMQRFRSSLEAARRRHPRPGDASGRGGVSRVRWQANRRGHRDARAGYQDHERRGSLVLVAYVIGGIADADLELGGRLRAHRWWSSPRRRGDRDLQAWSHGNTPHTLSAMVLGLLGGASLGVDRPTAKGGDLYGSEPMALVGTLAIVAAVTVAQIGQTRTKENHR